MTTKTCFWCGCDPNEKMPNNISPHATYCPHYRQDRFTATIAANPGKSWTSDELMALASLDLKQIPG